MEVMFWLILKHFVCDFPLQAHPYMYKNKGSYGHPGGILHASIHVAGTYAALFLFTPMALVLALADGLAHYHIDWAKMRLGSYMGWGPLNSEWFWILLGVDQLLHYLTYFILASNI